MRMTRSNPQSAIRNPQSAAPIHTSCGYYLANQAPDEESPPQPVPSGPTCSREPAPQQGLVPRIPRLFEHSQISLLACGGGTDAAADDDSDAIPPSEWNIRPRMEVRGIFRPPRFV
jgi:hypothetical protein